MRRPHLLAIATLCSLALGIVSSTAVAATALTWSGEGPAGADTWSNPANWSGGSAPGADESIGSLSFPSLVPPLTDSDCFGGPPTDACYGSENDLSGLSVNELQLDDADQYSLTGEGFTLGAGGLRTTDHVGSGGFATIALPLTLGADQTWQISGGASGGDGLLVEGSLTGASAALSVNLSQAASLTFYAEAGHRTDSEVGDVVVSSTDDDQNEAFGLTNATLNGSDGHSLTLHDVTFRPRSATTGPLILQDTLAELAVSSFNTTLDAQAETSTTLTTAAASFDAASTLALPITGTGLTPGQDFSQLSASGPVSLGSVTLEISDELAGGCPAVPVGQVDTLITTTGSLSGTFGNAPNGSIVSTHCLSATGTPLSGESFRIDYHASGEPQTVTAIALEGSSSSPPPSGGSEPPSSSTNTTPPSSSTSNATPAAKSAGTNPTPTVNTKPKAKPLSRARKLARALKACKHLKPKHRRQACEAKARKQYGAKKVKRKG